MSDDLNKTWCGHYPTFDFSEAGFCAAGKSGLALLWRRVRERGVKGLISRHSEEPQRRSNLGLALLWRRVRKAGVKGLISRHCQEPHRRSYLTSALLWRWVRETGVKGLVSRHSERSEESLFGSSNPADPSQNRLRMTSGKYIEEQIAAQKSLAMTESSVGHSEEPQRRSDLTSALLWRWVRKAGVKGLISRHCQEPQRRSNLVFILESCHSERSEESLFGSSYPVEPSQNQFRMTSGKYIDKPDCRAKEARND